MKGMKANGFSLIELIVVITIIIILSGMSLAAFFEFQEIQAARNDARSLETVLRKVQSMSKNLVYPPFCTGLTGYRIVSDCSGAGCQAVSASAVCDGGEIEVIDGEKIFEEANFSSNVNVLFLAATGAVDSAVQFPVVNINNMVINLDTNGNITIQ